MSRVFAKLSVSLAFLIALVPVTPAISEQIGSNTSGIWTVSETHLNSSGQSITTPLGSPQYVCLNAQLTPAQCPAGALSYDYTYPAWAADVSAHAPDAKWIWATKKPDGTPITSATTGAANAQYSFTLTFYLCGRQPKDGTIWVAADDKVDVYVNGAMTPILSWTGASSVGTATIPAASLNASPNANTIELRVKNGADPVDCDTDKYQCNPAGVLFAGDFRDELEVEPKCTNPTGNVGDVINTGACQSPMTGSHFKACICAVGVAFWSPDYNTCMNPKVQCKGQNGGYYNPGDSETVGSCSADQTGSITHTCQNDGSWGPVVNTCMAQAPPAKMCADASGKLTVPINTVKTVACPSPTTGNATETCGADGTWGPADTHLCTLPLAGADGICGSAARGQTAACRQGQMCGSCLGPLPAKPPQCFFGVDCPVQTRSADWYCDCTGYQGEPLGKACNTNYACASGYCDAGANTRQTNECMPRGNTGQRGDLCTADNQCSNAVPLKCVGLLQKADGSWQPGHCQ
jgi:hypothetical protein